jgi:hypothetical protein
MFLRYFSWSYIAALNAQIDSTVNTNNIDRNFLKLESDLRYFSVSFAQTRLILAYLGYYFAFELLIASITTYTKYPVGRLRPHFIEVCRPMVSFPSGNRTIWNSGCSGIEETFLTNYTCLGSSKAAIKEARLSFFSGHSSLAMGAATYSIVSVYKKRLKF